MKRKDLYEICIDTPSTAGSLDSRTKWNIGYPTDGGKDIRTEDPELYDWCLLQLEEFKRYVINVVERILPNHHD